MILIFPIIFYRYLISPVIGPRCRFVPSCSEYAIESIQKKGIFRGIVLAVNRIRKCHPKGSSGFDPVP